MHDRPLYCIVATKEQARSAAPDMNQYSPKELAAREKVSTTTVYAWIKEGLPVMRRGRRGNIRIFYQDYVAWMLECAKDPECKTTNIPVWAYWHVRFPNKLP